MALSEPNKHCSSVVVAAPMKYAVIFQHYNIAEKRISPLANWPIHTIHCFKYGEAYLLLL